MRLLPLALILASTSLLPACAGRLETTVRKRAAGDFACTQDQVQVETTQYSGMSGTYVARGCGQESEYVSRCGLIGICMASQPGPAPTYASNDGQSHGGGGDPHGGGGGSYDSPSSGSDPGPSQPAGPTIVSITLRNTCSQTVKLFFGDKPKFGSGTYSSLGSNTSTSYSKQAGDMIWIVDDGQNGISSVTIEGGMRTVEINSDCGSFSAR
ncbi:hypothetical protein [Paraliomyxa miuraensis]|uniref:hypothetical protein n=1 Tax=Paraliomyxa miuraensis TaxID=376150 RepID=UPI002251279F|nr:hypothetical protein [Paraliomyxa miuraensis]MCX4246058.1 hypothetical protein [Paraliomyxa miuraensis]